MQGTRANEMPALFPRWTNIVARGSLLGIIAIAGGVPMGLMMWVRSPAATGQYASVSQPIPFDHRVHAGGLKLDCRYCHTGVERAASAGVPPTAACIGCHRPALMQSAIFDPVRLSQQRDRPIAWNRVNALPDFVFFNHSIHVAKGIGCETCHGRVDQMSRVEQVTPMSMGWCLSCHRDPTPHLRPRADVTTMGWDAANHRPRADSLAVRLSQEYAVRRLTSCTTCHR